MLTADSLETLPGIHHGFFSRQGGVNDGSYSSFNCGFDHLSSKFGSLKIL